MNFELNIRRLPNLTTMASEHKFLDVGTTLIKCGNIIILFLFSLNVSLAVTDVSSRYLDTGQPPGQGMGQGEEKTNELVKFNGSVILSLQVALQAEQIIQVDNKYGSIKLIFISLETGF